MERERKRERERRERERKEVKREREGGDKEKGEREKGNIDHTPLRQREALVDWKENHYFQYET